MFSLYSNDERSFLVQLAQILGAEVQESFIRSNQPLLVCPEPKSAKYDAAIRWSEYIAQLYFFVCVEYIGQIFNFIMFECVRVCFFSLVSLDFPVVNRNWIMECYTRQRRVPMKEFLVGDSIGPVDDIDEDEEVVSSQFATNEGIENINMENRGIENANISVLFAY